MEEGKAPSPEGTQTPDLKSWAFWRKRLARLLLAGAFGFAALELLPALPETQMLIIEPPAGAQLRKAKLTYFSAEDGEALLGTELVPDGAAPLLKHSVELPSAEYLVTIVASGTDSAKREQSYTLTRKVFLSGSTARVFLKPSKSSE